MNEETDLSVSFESFKALTPPAPARAPTKMQVRRDMVAEIQSNGMQTPLEFVLRIMNDDQLPRNERMDAAKAIMPYIHSRLNTIDVNATHHISHEDALAFLEEG